MKALVLLSSPRPQGNTSALTEILCDQLRQSGAQTEVISLYEKEIQPCVACRGCQGDWSTFACVRQDDVAAIAEKILDCDLIVLATPIYSWYCTPPMKALLDRLVYGMNKYYGEQRGRHCGREKPWPCWRPAGIRRTRAVTFWRRESGVTAVIPDCGIWAAMPSGM